MSDLELSCLTFVDILDPEGEMQIEVYEDIGSGEVAHNLTEEEAKKLMLHLADVFSLTVDLTSI